MLEPTMPYWLLIDIRITPRDYLMDVPDGSTLILYVCHTITDSPISFDGYIYACIDTAKQTNL